MPNPTPPFGWSDDKPDAELHTLQFGNGEFGSACFSISDGPQPDTFTVEGFPNQGSAEDDD